MTMGCERGTASWQHTCANICAAIFYCFCFVSVFGRYYYYFFFWRFVCVGALKLLFFLVFLNCPAAARVVGSLRVKFKLNVMPGPQKCHNIAKQELFACSRKLQAPFVGLCVLAYVLYMVVQLVLPPHAMQEGPL